jgi:hypothetical protein
VIFFNKIKVLVLRQRHPLTPSKFRPLGRFYCRTEKKSLPRRIFEDKKIFKFTAKFKFSSMPVTWMSFDKRLND